MTLLEQLRSTLVSAIDLIDGEPSEPPQPNPPPSPPTQQQVYPQTINLFGPVQAGAALTQTAGSNWQFVGNALTASTKYFPFAEGKYPDVHWARFVVVWGPGSVNNKIKFISADGGPTNFQDIGMVTGQATPNPVVSDVGVTAQLQQLVTNGVSKHIGFIAQGDGTPFLLNEVRLEILWKCHVS